MGADPADVEVLVGVDVGKSTHHATAINAAGEVLFDRQQAGRARSTAGCGV